VERTFSWTDQNRRMSKDYERLTETSEALIYVAMSRLMARRLTRSCGFSDSFYDFRVLPLREHPGSEGVSEIVKADTLRQISLLEKRLEVALHQVIPTHSSA
jgi:hypothetical protein